MRTNGWEASVQARAIDHKTFKWDVGFNIAPIQIEDHKITGRSFCY